MNYKFRLVPQVATPVAAYDIWHGLTTALTRQDCIADFESSFAKFVGVNHCHVVRAARVALYLILRGISSTSPRKEVVIPAYACPSVAASVIKAGLKLVICDISEKTLSLDLNRLSDCLGRDTLAIVAIHPFGLACEIDAIAEIGKSSGAFIIEDVAQAAGARYKGKMLGSLGDFAFFSLGPGKTLNTGDGGVIATNRNDSEIKSALSTYSQVGLRPALTALIKILATSYLLRPGIFWLTSKLLSALGFWSKPRDEFPHDFPIGKYTNLQAAIGEYALTRLAELNRVRRANGEWITKALHDVDGLSIISPLPESDPIYHRVPIVFRDRVTRDNAHRVLLQRGIRSGKVYERSIREWGSIDYEVSKSSFQVADDIRARLLTLPSHQFITSREMHRMVATITELCSDRRTKP